MCVCVWGGGVGYFLENYDSPNQLMIVQFLKLIHNYRLFMYCLSKFLLYAREYWS